MSWRLGFVASCCFRNRLRKDSGSGLGFGVMEGSMPVGTLSRNWGSENYIEV